jgi:rubrerythrin
MSKVINNTILKRINEDPEYFAKEHLINFLNQMKGQADHLQTAIKREEEYTKFYQMHHERCSKAISKFYSRNVFERILLAIRKEIR